MLTVFTPVYNRAYVLPHLYESLCRQTSGNFEWVIVDDGSTDNVSDLVEAWIAEGKIDIRFFRQPNGGKHRAINRGVKEARGELFFIVDSDDYIADNTVEWALTTWAGIVDKSDFCGISGVRITESGKLICSGVKEADATVVYFRYRLKAKGDLAEAWRTDLLRANRFPEFEDERFVPEALIWNRIGKKLKVRFTTAPIYICKYLPDGLTAKIVKIRHESPKASMLYYSEESRLDIPLNARIKAYINFWRFAFSCRTLSFAYKFTHIGAKGLYGLLPGYLMNLHDRK